MANMLNSFNLMYCLDFGNGQHDVVLVFVVVFGLGNGQHVEFLNLMYYL